jgi:hypothetical protein
MVHGFIGEATIISETLGVPPTRTWKQGDRVHPNATNVYRQSGWMRESPVDAFKTTPEQSIAALLALFPDHGAFARLPPPSEIEVSATLYGLTERPYFSLSARLLAQLGAIGADLDLDIYDLSSSAESGNLE